MFIRTKMLSTCRHPDHPFQSLQISPLEEVVCPSKNTDVIQSLTFWKSVWRAWVLKAFRLKKVFQLFCGTETKNVWNGHRQLSNIKRTVYVLCNAIYSGSIGQELGTRLISLFLLQVKSGWRSFQMTLLFVSGLLLLLLLIILSPSSDILLDANKMWMQRCVKQTRFMRAPKHCNWLHDAPDIFEGSNLSLLQTCSRSLLSQLMMHTALKHANDIVICGKCHPLTNKWFHSDRSLDPTEQFTNCHHKLYKSYISYQCCWYHNNAWYSMWWFPICTEA